MAQNDVEYTLKNGSVIQDTYEILEPIGQGGMGAAYKAKHIAMGHLVAVKVVNQNLTQDTRTLELFKREANLLRELSQSDPDNAIVKIETLLQDKAGTFYLIMEYIDGQPLSYYTKRGAKLRDEDLMKFAERMINALNTIHSKNIIHRDISPDNIMVPNENILDAKILDFGVATDTLLGEKSIIGDTFAGKLGYASPEQMGLFGGEVTGKSDLYSLGLVLLSTAGLKGVGTSDMAAAVESRKQDYDLSDSKLSPDARALIEGLLKADPKDRRVFSPASVAVSTDVAPPLATVSNTDDTMFLEDGQTPTTKKPLLIAAGVGILAILGVGGAMFMGGSAPQVDGTAPEVQVEVASLPSTDVNSSGSGQAAPSSTTPSATPSESEAPVLERNTAPKTPKISDLAKEIFLQKKKKPQPAPEVETAKVEPTKPSAPASKLPDPFSNISILIDLGGQANLAQAKSALERVAVNTQYERKQRARAIFMLGRMYDPKFHGPKVSPDPKPNRAKALEYYRAAKGLGANGLENDMARLGG